MDERSSVLEDVKEIGLTDSLPEPFGWLLEEMARLAERSGGREFSATPIQIANYAGIDSKLGEDERAAAGSQMISEMFRAGIVELVEENTNRYRIPGRSRLDEIAKQIDSGELRPPFIHVPMRSR